MARPGRPKSARAASAQIVRLKLRLYPGEDDDLIAFFGDIPLGLRAASVKRALREGASFDAGRSGPESDLMDALDAFLL